MPQVAVQPQRSESIGITSENERVPPVQAYANAKSVCVFLRARACLAVWVLVCMYNDRQYAPVQVRSGQVRFITRPKSRTTRATRQLMLPPSTVS